MNNIDRVAAVGISFAIFSAGSLVVNGGFYSKKFRFDFDFGDYNLLIGGGLIGFSIYVFLLATK
ncbi:hypothetical protein Q670_08915 [Alcanivorax sp. P2S70]|uniref:hypothetical protein n=1 Tax=Alcanivorax sp. P2S70 TaxID=1397527 RepID=UPI0003B5D9D8|nr:hypothetical protein [Alcanivorax sp. P2S70]ERP92752.1 hypothetical protein Q670_08915 [Alcanivorax sp. P2S70]